MPPSLPIVSSDSHINEPPELWTAHATGELEETAPHVVSTDEGDAWVLQPGTAPRAVSSSAYAGLGWKAIAAGTVTYKAMRPGSFDPKARLEDMDIDGVAAEVLYPGVARYLSQFADEVTRARCASIYNDWMADFQAAAPERYVGLAVIPPLEDGDACSAELRRASSLGLRGAFLAATLDAGALVDAPGAEQFWQTAAELGIPVSLHIGAGSANLTVGHSLAGAKGSLTASKARRASVPMSIAPMLSAILLSGILDRYRDLRVVVAESGIGWLPYLLERLDGLYPDALEGRSASEAFAEQVFATFQDDEVGVELRRHLGMNSLMWASDYPHTDTTWPESLSVIERNFATLPEDERRAITSANCAELYSIPLAS